MKNLRKLIFILSCISTISCNKNNISDDSVESNLKGEGVFVVNEGNFNAGNGSLSFYSYSTGMLYNDIFQKANGRALGDIPNSMVISGSDGYIIVNNSGKIEVVNKNTMISASTISGLNSPRNLLLVSSQKAYVSSLYSNSLTIIDLQTNSVSGTIPIRRSSEAMTLVGERAYISSWYSGKEVVVINTATDKIVDSITVASEPESMVLDKNNKLWVLCSGGYTGQTLAELDLLNPQTDKVEKRFTFATKLSYPSSLQINKTLDTLYYVDNGLWKMGIQSASLPSNPMVLSGSKVIYKIGVDPRYGKIYFTDVVDYQQKGHLFQVSSSGLKIDSCQTDIIPGSLCFK